MEEEYADAGDIDVKENYDPVSTGKECSEILSCCFWKAKVETQGGEVRI